MYNYVQDILETNIDSKRSCGFVFTVDPQCSSIFSVSFETVITESRNAHFVHLSCFLCLTYCPIVTFVYRRPWACSKLSTQLLWVYGGAIFYTKNNIILLSHLKFIQFILFVILTVIFIVYSVSNSTFSSPYTTIIQVCRPILHFHYLPLKCITWLVFIGYKVQNKIRMMFSN